MVKRNSNKLSATDKARSKDGMQAKSLTLRFNMRDTEQADAFHWLMAQDNMNLAIKFAINLTMMEYGKDDVFAAVSKRELLRQKQKYEAILKGQSVEQFEPQSQTSYDDAVKPITNQQIKEQQADDEPDAFVKPSAPADKPKPQPVEAESQPNESSDTDEPEDSDEADFTSPFNANNVSNVKPKSNAKPGGDWRDLM